MAQPETSSAKTIGIIVLAAGASSRLGKPKQLLLYKGESLLHHSVKAAIETKLQPVIAVLGSNAERVRKEAERTPVHVVINTQWQEGMASSIRCGVNALLESAPSVEGLILMVCDQPFVDAALLREVIAAHLKSGKPIVACSYEDSFGPPVFFHRSLFSELLQLRGDIGARGVIRRHANEVAVVPFAAGTIDVDTEADYEKLKKNQRTI